MSEEPYEVKFSGQYFCTAETEEDARKKARENLKQTSEGEVQIGLGLVKKG